MVALVEESVSDMSAIELADGDEVKTGDEQPEPTRTKERVMVDFIHGRNKGSGRRDRSFENPVESAGAECQPLCWERSHLRIFRVDRIQVPDRRECEKADDQGNDRDDKSRNGSRSPYIQKSLPGIQG